jgi:hypothetical protein
MLALRMATPIFETKARLSRTLGVDIRNSAIRQIPPDGYLQFRIYRGLSHSEEFQYPPA